MSKRRKEDGELWERVKRTTKPLHSNRATSEFKAEIGEMHVPSPTPIRSTPRIIRPYTVEPTINISLAPKPSLLDQSVARKIAKGRTGIDGRIDLHGMTQVEAHSRLYRFIENAYLTNRRTILVITGKGVRGEGILRQAVPRWLSEPEFRKYASGYHEAHVTHGGGGALYVRIRNPIKVERK